MLCDFAGNNGRKKSACHFSPLSVVYYTLPTFLLSFLMLTVRRYAGNIREARQAEETTRREKNTLRVPMLPFGELSRSKREIWLAGEAVLLQSICRRTSDHSDHSQLSK